MSISSGVKATLALAFVDARLSIVNQKMRQLKL